jgi:hypothetical protein
MTRIIPKELVNIILEYSCKIKYRNGIYVDQIDLTSNKYNLVIKNIQDKINILKKIVVQNSGAYCLNTSIGENIYGITHWHDFGIYMFAFYKCPNNSTIHSFCDVYYKFLGFYVNNLPISTYEYK